MGFPEPRTGEPYRNRRKQIQNACKLAGVPYSPRIASGTMWPYFLADTHKESLPTIQKMLGHRNVTTTAKVCAKFVEDVVEAAEKLKVTQLAHTN